MNVARHMSRTERVNVRLFHSRDSRRLRDQRRAGCGLAQVSPQPVTKTTNGAGDDLSGNVPARHRLCSTGSSGVAHLPRLCNQPVTLNGGNAVRRAPGQFNTVTRHAGFNKLGFLKD